MPAHPAVSPVTAGLSAEVAAIAAGRRGEPAPADAHLARAHACGVADRQNDAHALHYCPTCPCPGGVHESACGAALAASLAPEDRDEEDEALASSLRPRFQRLVADWRAEEDDAWGRVEAGAFDLVAPSDPSRAPYLRRPSPWEDDGRADPPRGRVVALVMRVRELGDRENS